MCERELETEQNCNILIPTLLDITAFLSRSPVLLNRGPEAQPLCLLVFSTSSYFLLVWSATAQSGAWGPSAGSWLSLPHLVSNWSGLQTNWLPVSTELYNISNPNFLWASQIALIPLSTAKATLCYSSTRCTCYLHWRISYFDSSAWS